uniref:AAA ATPase AAA+ lid domain-containing protein n=1 Tax=Fagus sylvatica TaxID=28930 RepID=A0A2N9GFX8_FAGSY
MAGEKLKKLKKPIQGMAPEVEAKFNAANEEEFPKRCAWKIEMETMRRQLAVLTEQFQKYKPPQDPEFKHVFQQQRRAPERQQQLQASPFMGYHREFGQQWEGKDQNQRYESKYEQKWKGSVKIDVPEFSGVLIPDDLIDWINHVECVFEYHDIPNHKKVKLVGTKLKGRASAWWEQDPNATSQIWRTLQYQVLAEALAVPTSLSSNLGKSKNAQPVQSAHTSNNVATKTSFVGKPKNSNLSCKHYKYGEESHKSIECKKPALQAKNKTLMTKTMEEESDVATGRNIPIMQLDATIQCSNWQQHSSTAAFQYSEGMMKDILMIEENQEEDYLQEPVYDQYQEPEEVSEGILMIEEIVEQPPVYDIEVEAEIGDDQAEGITLEGMMTFKPVSNQFVLENMDATTKILQVSKEEMEEKNRLANKISHTTCSSEDKACDLLIEGNHCSLHKREHHYTLRPKKDTSKSKPMVHARNKYFRSEEEKEALLQEIAELTEDFTGAELQNILNEAGILTARKDLDFIGREELLEALKRQKGTFETGQEDSKEIPEELKLRLAYREAAVAVVACYFPDPYRPFTETDIKSIRSQPNMQYTETSGRVFSRKSDYVNAIVRACAPRVIEEEMFGVDNMCWISAKATLEASKRAEFLILQTGMTAFGKAYYRNQRDLVPNLAAKLEAIREEYMRYAVEKCSSVLREYHSAVETITDILLEKGEIKAEEMWNVYKRAPRIPQPAVNPVDEYGALIYAGRWGIHGITLPGRVTFAPGNVGFSTFGAPRPMETQIISDETWKLIDGIWDKRVEEIKAEASMEVEEDKEKPQLLMASHFL